MPEVMKGSSGHKLFALFVSLSLLVFWRPLWTLGQFALGSEQYSHILLIPFVSLVLLFQKRSRFFGSKERDWTGGSALVGAGVLLHTLYLTVGNGLSENDRISLAIFSAVLVWLGLFLLCYGRESFRGAVFPLCFLFLMVPIPEVILGMTIEFLQKASAETTDILFRISGIPVYRQGLVFSLPGVTIEVARECSGIRSSLALFTTSLLAGHLFLRTRGRKALLLAFVLPITVFKNGVRIVSLAALAVYVDPVILDSTAHRRGGIPIFGLALVLLGAVLWILRKTEGGSWTWRRKCSA